MDSWVVVVDDEVLSLTNAKNILGAQGMRVSCLKSGKDLLRFMENNTPDLILLDVLMPEMNGFETLQALRRFEEEKGRHETPVIFLTGDNDSKTEQRGLHAGASDFIRKPFHREILLTRIQNTIEKSRTIENLTEEAAIDKLTGFLNKASGTKRIEGLCESASGALMILDLDNFKLVNDLYGHDMGDRVLAAFARILKINTREKDVLSRIGGDEFMAFFMDISDERAVASVSGRVNDQLMTECRELMGNDFDIPIGVSVGVSMIPQHGTEYERLFQLADQTLYKVKQGGKHGYGIYDSGAEEEKISDPVREMERISRILEERGTGCGALLLGQEAFSVSYRYILRYAKRYSRTVTKLLLTLTAETEETELLSAVESFSEVLQRNLRKSDIILKHSANQFFLLLPELEKKDVDCVVNRITEVWKTEGRRQTVRISHVADTVTNENILKQGGDIHG